MFETKENKDRKITVRFTGAEVEVMEQYIKENNLKNITELIRVAVGEKVKV